MVFPALDYTHGSILPKQKNERILVICYENTTADSVDVLVQDAADISAFPTVVPLEREAAMASRPTTTQSLINASVQLAVSAPAAPAVPGASSDGVVASPAKNRSTFWISEG